MLEPTRYKLTFSKGEGVKYISHLDLMRVFERAMRRANLPLDYSLGFNPRPKISIAAPAAVGIMAEAELMDIILTRPIEMDDLAVSLNNSLPAAIRILAVEPLALNAPSLQSLVYAAEYRVSVFTTETMDSVRARVGEMMGHEHLIRTRQRKDGVKEYDLRPLVRSVEVERCEDGKCYLKMDLANGPQGSGRPEEVVSALGLPVVPLESTRLRLYLAGEE
jgi:radical SAM-linked protein